MIFAMYYKNGFFLPDGFPWEFDHVVSVLHKVAVINGVSGKVLLSTVDQKKTTRGSVRGQAYRINKALENVCEWPYCYYENTHSAAYVEEFFPRHMSGAPKYCAQCLEETGLVPVLFTLEFVEFCPWHHLPLRVLCRRCCDVRKFKPEPFNSPVGYRCLDCGYWVSSRSSIVAACRCHAAEKFIKGCNAFFENAERFARLGVIDVLRVSRKQLIKDEPAVSVAVVNEIQPNEETKVWTKVLCLTSANDLHLLLDQSYRDFIRFHQWRLLRAHGSCICRARLLSADSLEGGRDLCVYSATLSLFRQKFEFSDAGQALPRLSVHALTKLRALRMSPSEARRFFQCVFYDLMARIFFWRQHASRFFVHIDPMNFYHVFRSSRSDNVIDRLLGTPRQWEYRIRYDLPATRVAMRHLLRPCGGGDGLQGEAHAGHAEFMTHAQDARFFGDIRATAMFYF